MKHLSIRIGIFILSLCCLISGVLWPSQGQATEPLTIVFLTPRGDDYWKYTAGIAQAVAKDLGVKLVWLPAHNSPEKHLELAKQVLVDKTIKADGMMLKNYDNQNRQIVPWAEKAQIPIFTVGEGFIPEDRKKFGMPREKYPHWIGEFLVDDFDAGYRLAHYLADEAQKRGLVDAQGKVHLVALTGNSFEGSSLERVKGLQTALSERDDVILQELVTGHWKLDKGRKRMAQLLNDYPETHAVWVANDSMAVGSADTLKTLGLIQGKDILLSSTGTITQGVIPLVKGDTVVSIGGNFLDASWSLVVLFDYLKGYDFASESTVMRYSLSTFTAQNIQRYYERVIKPDNWELLDFTRFSKALNPKLKKYNFSFQAIVEQL